MPVSNNLVPLRERLIFALDVPTVKAAHEMADSLAESVSFYKLGLELFMDSGYFQLLQSLVANGKKVFVDLKFFDVPATVGRAVARLNGSGATYCTVHGNDGMLEAACANRGDLKILAVTALTSLDRKDLEDLGFDCDARELVLSRARRAFEIGCDGVISSGLEVAALREEVSERLIVVTPGMRPVENRHADDQKRTVDVRQAFSSGADHVVIGRLIRDAENPRVAAEKIQRTIAEFFSDS